MSEASDLLHLVSGISEVVRSTKFIIIFHLTYMVLVFGLVVGLWQTLAGGLLASMGGEQGIG